MADPKKISQFSATQAQKDDATLIARNVNGTLTSYKGILGALAGKDTPPLVIFPVTEVIGSIGSPYQIQNAQSGYTFTNAGAAADVELLLPASPQNGDYFEVKRLVNHWVLVYASPAHTIVVNGLVSVAGGYVGLCNRSSIKMTYFNSLLGWLTSFDGAILFDPAP